MPSRSTRSPRCLESPWPNTNGIEAPNPAPPDDFVDGEFASAGPATHRKATAATAAPTQRVVRPWTTPDNCYPFSLAPAGLAVGLALKRSRYAKNFGDSPRGADERVRSCAPTVAFQSGPPFPGTGAPRDSAGFMSRSRVANVAAGCRVRSVSPLAHRYARLEWRPI